MVPGCPGARLRRFTLCLPSPVSVMRTIIPEASPARLVRNRDGLPRYASPEPQAAGTSSLGWTNTESCRNFWVTATFSCTMSPQNRLGVGLRASAALVGASCVFALSSGALVSWMISADPVGRVLPGWVPMAPTTALGLFASSLATALLALELPARQRRGQAWIARGCAAFAVTLGVLKLADSALGIHWGLDSLIVQAPGMGTVPFSAEGMSSVGALTLALIGGALACLSGSRKQCGLAAQPMCVAGAMCALVAVSGFLYDSRALRQTPPFAGIGLHTALALLTLCLVIPSLRPAEGVMALVNADTAGGALVRRLLPIILVVPVLLNWLELSGERLGWYSERFAWMLDASVTVLLLGASVWRVAWLAHDKDQARQKAEEGLRLSEERYRRLIETSPSAIIVKGERRIEFANAAAARLLGATGAEDLVGKPILSFLAPESYAAFKPEFCRMLEEGQTLPLMEQKLRRHDGASVDLEISASAVDYQGRRWAQIVAYDVSDRRRVEQAARLSEARFQATFEQAAVGMALLAPGGRFLRVNDRLREITGYPGAELLDISLDDLAPAGAPPASGGPLGQLLAGEIGAYSVERECRRKDGGSRWIQLTISLARQTDGAPRYFICVVEDITQRRALEIQLGQAQKMESIGLLAGGVAHDFNNLLAALMLEIELAGRAGNSVTETREALREMKSTTQRAADLVRQLLLFSRRQVMQPRLLDLNEAVGNLSSILRRIVRENVRQELLLSSTPLPVLADPSMIDQVLVNLAVNARDAMPSGGTLTLQTSEQLLEQSPSPGLPAGRYASLAVTDTGCGISPEILPRIFEPFFTTKDIGKGTGLGLATVYGIVQQHQGAIRVRSEPGRGATFQVLLPLREAPPKEDDAPLANLSREGAGCETILLVEDDRLLRAATGALLRRRGYVVLEAADGAEALSVWREQNASIALLITDLVMPGGIDGRSLGGQLQSEKPTLAVIFTSGYDPGIAGRELRLDSGQVFLPKPASPEDLLAAIEQGLEHAGPTTPPPASSIP